MINRQYLIIAGVNKAGTTSLFTYLAQHEEICASDVKEVQFFLPIRYGIKGLPPLSEYEQHFQCGKGMTYNLEATGGYFYGGEALARRMKTLLGDVRIIFLFREPISRMFSFFKFKKNMLELDPQTSFEEYLKDCESFSASQVQQRKNNLYWGLEGGFYADYLQAWYDVFGEERINIFFTQQLAENPAKVLEEICLWLKIEADCYLEGLELSVENKSVGYRFAALQRFALGVNWKLERFWRTHLGLKRKLRRLYYLINGTTRDEFISPGTRDYLEGIYRPYNQRLARQLIAHGHTKLPDWLELESDQLENETAKS